MQRVELKTAQENHVPSPLGKHIIDITLFQQVFIRLEGWYKVINEI